MKEKIPKKIVKILNIVLRISLVVGTILLLTLWKWLELLNIKFNLLVFLIYPAGILFLGLIIQFIKLFNQFNAEKSFHLTTVRHLKNASRISFVISIITFLALLLSIFIYPTYTLTLKISLTFFTILFIGVGIALYLLAELFRQATEFKEENDLTI